MNFLELARKRKTTYEFDNRNLSTGNITKILEAGRWAPSCDNSQPWNFIIIKNKNMIDRLMRTVNYGDFHYDPTLMIAIVLREERCKGKRFSCFSGKDSLIYDSYMCCGMAALQMILEAADLKIDSCLLTPQEDEARKLLKVKPIDALPLMIGFGYKKRGSFQKRRTREELKKLIFYEYFGSK